MIKRGCYILFFLFQVFFSFAQIKIRGTVKDSSDIAINPATISIIDSRTKVVLLYAYTNKDGYYILESDETVVLDSILIKVTSPLFFSQEKKLQHREQVADFVLASEPRTLPPVIVGNTRPLIKIKGDTLSYKVADFVRNTDRVIADVIRSIPGIEVLDNGMIRYQGKSINYFYIDGENMFDKGYRVATDNIPVDYVEKIQVIENNQHIKALNGIVPSYDPALNITLTNKAKTIWENTAKAAAGGPGVYDGELVNLAFKSRFNLLNTVKANNVGKDPMDEVRGFSNNTEAGSGEESVGVSTLLSAGLANTPSIEKERYQFNNSSAINVNDFVKAKNGMSFRTNSYYVFNKQQLDYSYFNTYYLPGDTIKYTEQQHQLDVRNDMHIMLNVNKNVEKEYFDNTFSVDHTSGNLSAEVISNGQPVSIQLKEGGYSFSNKLYGVKVFHKHLFIEYNSQINYQEKPQSLSVYPGLHPDILNNGFPLKSVKQDATIPSLFTNNYIRFRRQIKDISLQLRAGVQYQHTNLLTQLYKEDFSNNIKMVPDSFVNHLNWQKLQVYVDPFFEWRNKKTIITVSLPVKYMTIHYDDTSFNKQGKANLLVARPVLNINQQIGSESNLYSTLTYNNSYSGVENVFYGNVMMNYLSFESNDAPLQQRKYRNANMRYEYRKGIKLFFLTASLNYAETTSDFLYSSSLDNGVIRNRLLFQPNTIYVSNANISASKYIYPLKVNVAAKYYYTYSRLQQLQNGILFPSDFTTQTLSWSLQTRLSPAFSFNYQSIYIWGTTKRSNAARKETYAGNYASIQKCKLSFMVLKRIAAIFQNEYYDNHQQNQPSKSFIFSDIVFRYSFYKNKTDIELAVNNIADAGQYSVRTISVAGLSGSDYTLRPRMVLLRVGFRF